MAGKGSGASTQQRAGWGYSEICYEEREGVGLLTLARPEARNTLTHRTYRELERAAELLLTGEVIGAEQVLRIGLVDRVVPHDELLREALDPDWQALGTWVARSLSDLFRTEDHREGIRAFLEKRAPRYRGR